jgi:hypothetical protein
MVMLNAPVALPVIVIDPARFDSVQERAVEIQAMAKMTSNTVFGKRVFHPGVNLVIEAAQ